MMDIALKILPHELIDEYHSQFDMPVQQKFEDLTDSELSTKTFSFYTSVSAVFSSRIEGEDIELDSYLKHKMMGVKFLPDYTRKIDDLYEAYTFAHEYDLNVTDLGKAHEIITRHILQKKQRGALRSGMMYVIMPDGRIEYVACAPAKVASEMGKFYSDIMELLNAELTFEETFFFAALIHLVFVKIHPFDDGNGRTARLLEKWFLAQKLGDKAWFVPSEKYYYSQHQIYYANIRLLGLEYEQLDYSNALPFLVMLPGALTTEK
jgi:Fic family protein